jgi:hypothetical protein
MIKRFIILGALAALSTHAQADVGVMVGVGWAFGGAGPAITVKALSSDKRNQAVAAAGVSYYPLSENKWGLDAGVGYNSDNAAAIISWDFLQGAAQLSGGWSDTESSRKRSPAPEFEPEPEPEPPVAG